MTVTDKRRTSKGDKGIVSFQARDPQPARRGRALDERLQHVPVPRGRRMTRRVAVIGGAASPNGKLQTAADAPLQALEHEILAPLVIDAMAAAGLPKEEIGALVFAMCRPYTLQKYFATFMANYLRLPLKGTIMEVLGNGMTGGHGLRRGGQYGGAGSRGRGAGARHQHGEPGELGRARHDDDAGHRRRRLPHHLRLHPHLLVRDGCGALHARVSAPRGPSWRASPSRTGATPRSTRSPSSRSR